MEREAHRSSKSRRKHSREGKTPDEKRPRTKTKNSSRDERRHPTSSKSSRKEGHSDQPRTSPQSDQDSTHSSSPGRSTRADGDEVQRIPKKKSSHRDHHRTALERKNSDNSLHPSKRLLDRKLSAPNLRDSPPTPIPGVEIAVNPKKVKATSQKASLDHRFALLTPSGRQKVAWDAPAARASPPTPLNGRSSPPTTLKHSDSGGKGRITSVPARLDPVNSKVSSEDDQTTKLSVLHSLTPEY